MFCLFVCLLGLLLDKTSFNAFALGAEVFLPARSVENTVAFLALDNIKKLEREDALILAADLAVRSLLAACWALADVSEPHFQCSHQFVQQREGVHKIGNGVLINGVVVMRTAHNLQLLPCEIAV